MDKSKLIIGILLQTKQVNSVSLACSYWLLKLGIAICYLFPIEGAVSLGEVLPIYCTSNYFQGLAIHISVIDKYYSPSVSEKSDVYLTRREYQALFTTTSVNNRFSSYI